MKYYELYVYNCHLYEPSQNSHMISPNSAFAVSHRGELTIGWLLFQKNHQPSSTTIKTINKTLVNYEQWLTKKCLTIINHHNHHQPSSTIINQHQPSSTIINHQEQLHFHPQPFSALINRSLPAQTSVALGRPSRRPPVVGGIYVAQSGFSFGLQIPVSAVITSVAQRKVTSLTDFETALAGVPNKESPKNGWRRCRWFLQKVVISPGKHGWFHWFRWIWKGWSWKNGDFDWILNSKHGNFTSMLSASSWSKTRDGYEHIGNQHMRNQLGKQEATET